MKLLKFLIIAQADNPLYATWTSMQVEDGTFLGLQESFTGQQSLACEHSLKRETGAARGE